MSDELNRILNEAIPQWAKLTGTELGTNTFTWALGSSSEFQGHLLKEHIENLNEARVLDMSGTTAILLLRGLFKAYVQEHSFKIHTALYEPEKLEKALSKTRTFHALITQAVCEEVVAEFKEAVRAAVVHYGYALGKLKEHLADERALGELRLAAARSCEKLDVHQFAQGKPDPNPLQYNREIFEFTIAVTREPYVVSRCYRCGCTSPGWACTSRGCGEGPVGSIELVDVEVTASRPVLAGWDFLACVEPLEGGNLIRQVPGAAIAEGELTPWREGPLRCDHCGTVRRRAETFIVRADGSDPAITVGTYKQVGRNCLEAFLGGKSAASIVAMLSWPAIVRGAAGEEDEGGGWFGGAPKVHDPIVFLGWVCGVIREDGWLSRGAARDTNGTRPSTSDQALYLMVEPWGGGDAVAKWHKERERCAPSGEALERATAALSWARALNPTSDYERNLALVARQQTLKPNHTGILASAVTAHTRALGRETEQRLRDAKNATRPNAHVGEVGQRLDLELTVERVVETESDFGALNILVMRDVGNNLFVWKTGAASAKPGEQLKLRATVKRHGEFRGTKQTDLTRGSIFEEWPAKPARKSRTKKTPGAGVETEA